jgi:SAM-dependent methyltransferase
VWRLPFRRLDTSFQCPICNHRSKYLWISGHDEPVLRNYQVIGGGARYATCIWCKSLDRDRLLWLYLQHYTSLLKSKHATLLHIAPEPCIQQKLQAQLGNNYVAGDKFEKGYKYAKGKTTYMDITQLAMPDDVYDYIICNHVLEHIPDDAKAMTELQRVLKPGGTAILQVPFSPILPQTLEDASVTSPEARLSQYGQSDHVRLYGNDYITRLTKCGFIVAKTHIAEQYPNHALNLAEPLFVCTK